MDAKLVCCNDIYIQNILEQKLGQRSSCTWDGGKVPGNMLRWGWVHTPKSAHYTFISPNDRVGQIRGRGHILEGDNGGRSN